MFGNHTTREGKEMPIFTMDTDHIINTINCYTKKVREAIELQKVNVSPFLMKIAGMQKSKISDEDIIIMKITALTMSKSYVLELCRRAIILNDKKAKDAFIKLMNFMDKSMSTDLTSLQLSLPQSVSQDTMEEYHSDENDDFYDYDENDWI